MTNPEYWAKDDIIYAQKLELFTYKAAPTAENWDIPASREQAAYAILLSCHKQIAYKKVDPNSIKDYGEIDDAMKDVIISAYQFGIINGRPGGTFGPKEYVTRAEISQMFVNADWVEAKSDIIDKYYQ